MEEKNQKVQTHDLQLIIQAIRESYPDAPTQKFSDRSATLGELFSAFADFQGKASKVKIDLNAMVDYQPRDKSKPRVHYRYATLDHILALVTPILAAQGLAVTQLVLQNELRTVLTHKSGEYICSVMNLPIQNQSQKDQGAWITYLRRYSLCAILGISGTEDKDADPEAGNPSGKDSESQTLQVFDDDAFDVRKSEIQRSINSGMTNIAVLNRLTQRGFVIEESVIASILKMKPNKRSDEWKQYQSKLATLEAAKKEKSEEDSKSKKSSK